MALDIVLHMTQKANPVTLLASPLGEEGHKVAKGWTVVILIMILDVDVTAEGGINYKTHRPIGRYHNPQRRRRCRPLSESDATCCRQAATTLGAQPRQPSCAHSA